MNDNKRKALEAMGGCLASLAGAAEDGVQWEAVRECFAYLGGTGVDKGERARVMANAAYQAAEKIIREQNSEAAKALDVPTGDICSECKKPWDREHSCNYTPKPGVYVLSKDIRNPKPDRRTRYDWRVAEVWEKGRRFTITTARHNYRDEGATYRIPRITSGRYHHEMNLRDVPAALVQALLPATETGDLVDWAIDEEGSSLQIARGVLTVLVDRGLITCEDIRTAVHEYLERPEEES